MPNSIPFPVPSAAARVLSCGLWGLMDVDGGATAEQQRVFMTLATHLLRVGMTTPATLTPLTPEHLAEELAEPHWRRLFLQMAIILDLCRHPKSERQLERLEHYAEALGVDPPQLTVVRSFAHLSAAEATARFIRLYEKYIPELSEDHGRGIGSEKQGKDDGFFEAVERLVDMPYGSLGWAFVQFYQRNGIPLPGRHTPTPRYYVCHDMNHVITGYEPTGPGEIALGGFKLALNNSDANWMASLTNFLIHEVGLFKHGTDQQFVPYGGGGEPYHGLDGRRGALDLPGSADLFAEALVRGASCRGDFTGLDHLAMAAEPLVEIRRRFHVLPLQQPMLNEPEQWPEAY